MEVDHGKNTPIYSKTEGVNKGNSLRDSGTTEDIIQSEWLRINRRNSMFNTNTSDTYGRLSIKRPCPFEARRLAQEKSGRLFWVGIIGAFFGMSGIHFFILKHFRRGIIRLGGLLLLAAAFGFGIHYFGHTNVGAVLISISTMLALCLFLLGYEEGEFLRAIATYQQRIAMKNAIRRFLQLQIGSVTIEALIKILIVIAFVGGMGFFYWYTMIRK